MKLKLEDLKIIKPGWRTNMDFIKVSEHADECEATGFMPPLRVVYDIERGRYYLVQGFEIYWALNRLDMLVDEVNVECRVGKREQGLTGEWDPDYGHIAKRAAMVALIEARPQWTNEQIAEHCSVTHVPVWRTRKELVKEANKQGKPAPAIRVKPKVQKQRKQRKQKAPKGREVWKKAYGNTEGSESGSE